MISRSADGPANTEAIADSNRIQGLTRMRVKTKESVG